MSEERRKYPRLVKPLEASWQGASGGSVCRIADISWGGCFVQTMAVPSVGERTAITVPVGSRAVDLPGVVVYREPSIGFSIRFDPLTADQIEVLAEVLGGRPE